MSPTILVLMALAIELKRRARPSCTEPFDPIELYDMMDWAWGVPKRSYVVPDVLR